MRPTSVSDVLANAAMVEPERAVVEQAKGALAHTRSLDMAAAFDALCNLAEEEGVSLGVAARRVTDRARAGTLDDRPTS